MAGRVLSKKNEHQLRAAMAAVEEILGQLPDMMAADGDTPPAKKKAKAMMAAESLRGLSEAILRQADSLDNRRQLLSTAIREKLRDPIAASMGGDRAATDTWVYIRDLFPDTAVYERDGKLYQIPYTILDAADAESVVLGAPVEVQICYVPVLPADASEAATGDLAEDFVPLTEKAIRSDGSATIKVISPGWGSSGYYPADVLKRDGPKVFGEGLKMYADHPTAAEEAARPERSIKDLAAVLTTGARWEDAGTDGPGLYAEAKVYDTWRPVIGSMAEDIGVSIRALGKVRQGDAEGRKGPIVEALVGAKSVDFVTDPGRGGKVLSLREAATKRQAVTKPQQPNGEEATMALTEAEAKALQESVASLQTETKNLALDNARLREANVLREAREIVAATLTTATLPALTKARLSEVLAVNPPVKDGAIDREAFAAVIAEAVKAEAAYLSGLIGSGRIEGMGSLAEARTEAKPEEITGSLVESFRVLGLSEEAAKSAAQGRA